MTSRHSSYRRLRSSDLVMKSFRRNTSTARSRRYASKAMGGRLASLLALCLPALAHADATAYTPPDYLTQTPPLPSTIDATSAWRLDLDDALQLAVKQNLGVTL